MIDIQSPREITANYMCSQSGSIQDLTAYSDHLPSSVLGSEAEPDSSSRQEFAHTPSVPHDMGLRFMTIAPPDDVRPDFGSSNNGPVSVCSIEPTVQNYSSSSNLSYSPYTHLYHHNLGATTYSSASNNYYSPTSFSALPDNKPRLSSLNSPGLGSLTRSQGLPHPGSPITTRDLYTGATPLLRRATDLPRSPPLPGATKVGSLTQCSSGFTTPTNMAGSSAGECPPLYPTDVIYSLQTTEGQQLKPDILAKIDKGFFMADNDWTCYRRNYFSLNCSYTILPTIPSGNVHLVSSHGGPANGAQVHAFSMTIAACVDGRDGKSIELVQHTPKRDKGPQQRPDRITLNPRHPSQLGLYNTDAGIGGSARGNVYESPVFNPNPSQTTTEAVFERIQFKNATANNGKRRAAQQYYHLLVELFADVGQQQQERWVKVATRMSAQMVVRGRSPGHYQSERRGSNASTGPGSGGAGGAGSYTSSNSSRTGAEITMSGTTSMLSGAGYGNAYDGRSTHHYRSQIATLQIPMEPTLSTEEAKSISESPGYQYYPGTIYESHEPRYQLPSVPGYTPSKMKQEYPSNQYVLPSLTNSGDGMGRYCGRWDGVSDSKGYFPTALLQQELNIS